MSRMKIGVLGCGMIAELGHLPALKNVAGLQLHAVYDVNWNRALAMQNRFQIPHAFPAEKAFWESNHLKREIVRKPEENKRGRKQKGTQRTQLISNHNSLFLGNSDSPRDETFADVAGP